MVKECIIIKTEDGTYKTILEIEDAKAEAEKKEQEKLLKKKLLLLKRL